MMQLIGDKIRTLRKRRGLSQEQLGSLVGFSQSKISKIENGDWDSLSDLRLIAKTLGVKLKDLCHCHGTRKMRIPCPGEKTVS